MLYLEIECSDQELIKIHLYMENGILDLTYYNKDVKLISEVYEFLSKDLLDDWYFIDGVEDIEDYLSLYGKSVAFIAHKIKYYLGQGEKLNVSGTYKSLSCFYYFAKTYGIDLKEATIKWIYKKLE